MKNHSFRNSDSLRWWIALTWLATLGVLSASAVGNVVIAEIYGGGGNSGPPVAVYRNDYVVLFNRGSTDQSLSGWSLQYASAAGNSWSTKYNLPSAVIPAGTFYLVQCASGGSAGSLLPTADAATTAINMSATAGKLALVNNTGTLTGTCPLPSASIVDFVGWGTAANCSETATAPGHNNANCTQRLGDGCADSDNNAADFQVTTCTPRNSASPRNFCNPPSGNRRFFVNNLLPPPNGMHIATQQVSYASGIVISNLAQRLFAQSVPPPIPGRPPVMQTFSSQVEMEVSFSGGPWNPMTGAAVMEVQASHLGFSGSEQVIANVVQMFNFTDGMGLMIRESPVLTSTGQTLVKPLPGGYMISSFFDIYLEISLDFGMTWAPALEPTHLELMVDPALIPSLAAPRAVLPMPNGQYRTPARWQAYANGIVISNLREKLGTQWAEPPALGASDTHTFDSQLDFQLSMDGGAHCVDVRAPGSASFGIREVRAFQGRTTYETEMTALNIAGGELPVGVMIRESPTRVSWGGNSHVAGGGGGGAGGGAAISSFFDIFTEVSIDGGGSWWPATNGPAHEELERVAPVSTFNNNSVPVAMSQYASPPEFSAVFANGIVISNLVNSAFAATIPPPPPGAVAPHTFGSQVEFDISYDGGLTYNHVTAPATDSMQTTCRLGGDSVTEYYDTEMTQLEIAGGSLPLGVQIRESPTRASFGRTTASTSLLGGGYQIDSFFDIFLEVSTDGGQSWLPCLGRPITVLLEAENRPYASLVASPPTVGCGVPVNLDASGSTHGRPDRHIVRYEWDFDYNVGGFSTDLDTGNSPTTTRTYLQAGVHTTAVRVTDNNVPPKTAIATATTTVSFVNVPPTANPGGPYTATLVRGVPQSLMLDGRGSSDANAPCDSIVAYEWDLNYDQMSFTADATGSTVTYADPTWYAGETRTIALRVTDEFGEKSIATVVINVVETQPAKKWYFSVNVLPPTNGVYVCTNLPACVSFPGGILIRNLAQRQPTAGVAPPPLSGGNVTHTFGSQVEMDVSLDGGLSWTPCAAPGNEQMRVVNNGPAGAGTAYGTEMQQLDLSGGTLPPGVMIRESPTRASTGQAHIEAGPGDYMISSFFDIYLEVSTDDGVSWTPATQAARLELMADPAVIPPVAAPRKVFPMPNGEYITPSDSWQQYANGIVIRDLKKKLFTGWSEPPLLGASQTHAFNAQLDFQLSTDGGLTFVAARAPATMTVQVGSVHDFQNQSTFESELTVLNIAGGDLPAGVMIRESPTRASRGGTCTIAGGGGGGAGGGAAISSFFDIFTEVSTDGGSNWLPANSAPAHEELARIAPVTTFSTKLMPPPAGQYECRQRWSAYFANGLVITGLVNRAFSASIMPPLPGTTVGHTFGSQVEMDVSYDGGLTYSHVTAPANNGVQITCQLGGDGVTEYYDTDMTQLSIAGGGLPSGVMIRESPTKASLGRTTMSANGTDNDCDSFFDIFTEVSTDGGQTWWPTVAGPMTVVLGPLSGATLTVACPSNITVRATSPGGAVVTYPPPTIGGGCPPIAVTCMPPGGSTFPIGTTTVSCSATDACGQWAVCSFDVTVLRQLKKRFFQQKLLPPPNGMYMPPATSVLTYPGGIIISNVALRVASAGVAPPPILGGNVTYSVNTTMELEISFDGGLTWHSCVVPNAPMQMYAVNSGADGVDMVYGGQTLALNGSGGTLPAGVMIRESPTKASAGETRIEPIPGGYMIDSFFDIYLEVSTDGGGTWMIQDGDAALQGQLNEQAEMAPPALAPRKVFPMPNGQYVSPGICQAYANGIVIRDLKKKLFTDWMEPPHFGDVLTHTFGSQLDFQLSMDGGSVFSTVRAPAMMTVRQTNVREFQAESTYETEVTQLNITGGGLPAGVMIRESPTRASLGGTCATAGGGGGGAGGGAVVQSFFDIFLEVTMDGGVTWWPATNRPAHEELERIAAVYSFTNNLLPPLRGQYGSQQRWWAYYANGIVISNFMDRSFTSAITPPLPGITTSHTFGSQVEMDVSTDGGLTYSHVTAPATDSMQITCRLGGDGVTEYYDTEMTQLDIHGGGLPAYIQIRESPTRASLGRTTMSADGTDNDCDSFFDIFTEVSTDGGLSWWPTVSGPGLVTLGVPAPQLCIRRGPSEVVLYWLHDGRSYVMQSRANLRPGTLWQAVSGTIVREGDYDALHLSNPTGNSFFRLCGNCATGP